MESLIRKEPAFFTVSKRSLLGLAVRFVFEVINVAFESGAAESEVTAVNEREDLSPRRSQSSFRDQQRTTKYKKTTSE